MNAVCKVDRAGQEATRGKLCCGSVRETSARADARFQLNATGARRVICRVDVRNQVMGRRRTLIVALNRSFASHGKNQHRQTVAPIATSSGAAEVFLVLLNYLKSLWKYRLVTEESHNVMQVTVQAHKLSEFLTESRSYAVEHGGKCRPGTPRKMVKRAIPGTVLRPVLRDTSRAKRGLPGSFRWVKGTFVAVPQIEHNSAALRRAPPQT
jgi:hypothetical protein